MKKQSNNLIVIIACIAVLFVAFFVTSSLTMKGTYSKCVWDANKHAPVCEEGTQNGWQPVNSNDPGGLDSNWVDWVDSSGATWKPKPTTETSTTPGGWTIPPESLYKNYDIYECKNVSGYWYDDACHSTPEESTSTDTTPPGSNTTTKVYSNGSKTVTKGNVKYNYDKNGKLTSIVVYDPDKGVYAVQMADPDSELNQNEIIVDNEGSYTVVVKGENGEKTEVHYDDKGNYLSTTVFNADGSFKTVDASDSSALKTTRGILYYTDEATCVSATGGDCKSVVEGGSTFVNEYDIIHKTRYSDKEYCEKVTGMDCEQVVDNITGEVLYQTELCVCDDGCDKDPGKGEPDKNPTPPYKENGNPLPPNGDDPVYYETPPGTTTYDEIKCFSCNANGTNKYVKSTNTYNASLVTGGNNCHVVSESYCSGSSSSVVENPTIYCWKCDVNGSSKYTKSNDEKDAEKVTGGKNCSIVPLSSCSVGKTDVVINPKTGTIAIVIAWILGILTIGYTFWYFKRISDIKKNN